MALTSNLEDKSREELRAFLLQQKPRGRFGKASGMDRIAKEAPARDAREVR